MMTKFLNFVKMLPDVLLRLGHLITHFFCDLDKCEEDDFEN